MQYACDWLPVQENLIPIDQLYHIIFEGLHTAADMGLCGSMTGRLEFSTGQYEECGKVDLLKLAHITVNIHLVAYAHEFPVFGGATV